MKTEIETAIKSLTGKINGDTKSEDAMRLSQAALNLAHVGQFAHHKNTPQIQITDAMVSRFLCWELPPDFRPDCYIAFDRQKAMAIGGTWPTGTNLLHAEQVRKMLEHVLAV